MFYIITATVAAIALAVALVAAARCRLAQHAAAVDSWATESGATVTRHRGRITVAHRYYPEGDHLA